MSLAYPSRVKLINQQIDQLANLHFHFTSVPRCTPMTPMEILHLINRMIEFKDFKKN